MGLIGRLLSFTRTQRRGAHVSDAKTNPGGGPNVTAEHYAPPGDDSHPLPGDYQYLGKTPQRGRYASLGYVDPVSEPQAQPGEKRIYARDTDGAVVVELHLKNDGEATLFNAEASVTVLPDGTVTVSNGNGSVTLAPDGSTTVTTPAGTFAAEADGSIKGSNANGSYELQAGGTFEVNGVTIDPTGAIVTPTTVSAAGVSATDTLSVSGQEMKDHKHSQGADSNGDTEQDTSGPLPP